MKNRKVMTVCAVILAAMALGACGSEKASGSESVKAGSAVSAASEPEIELSDEDKAVLALPLIEGDSWKAADCLTLGSYEGMELERPASSVSEEEVEAQIKSMVEPTEVTDEGASVEVGDTVNIAYKGTREGVAFEGGTSDSYDLVIGSHSFIDGFEDGLVGMKKGETRKLDLTFPENYGSAELAGRAVVFEVTVHSISRPEEISNAWVAANTDYKTVEDYRAATREKLESAQMESARETLRQSAWTRLMEESEYKGLPAGLVERGGKTFEDNAKKSASGSGMDLEAYLKSIGMSRETYDRQKDLYGRYAARSKVLLQMVLDREGIREDSQEYRDKEAEVAGQWKVSVEDLRSQYGEEEVRDYCLMQLALDRIVDKAEVREVTDNG